MAKKINNRKYSSRHTQRTARATRKISKKQVRAALSMVAKMQGGKKPSKPATNAKRGTEIFSVFTGSTYHGTISRHGRAHRSYSYTTTRGRTMVQDRDLALVCSAVRKMHKHARITTMVYGGR